jgi:two-component system response regulator AtoC
MSTERLLGDSKVLHKVREVLRRAAAGHATVLIRGESGTGKELVARAVHAESPRAERPFVKIDCTSLPDALLESELFGYERGAFTGADARKQGRVELADGGTLFLDEVGELGMPVQAKLLRLLQDREIERLGGTRTLSMDVRVVAATHRDLETMVARGQFRQDLFYRLNVVPLWLPPLRARRADIELLARHFVATFAAANDEPITIDDEALRLLRRQRWPGNVRQLQNMIERLVVLATGPTIDKAAVSAELSQRVRFETQPNTTQADITKSAERDAVVPLDAEVHASERRALRRALEHARGNRAQAARLLGISRSTFYAKLAEHGLS